MTRTPPPAWLTARPIAHRGLHDVTAGRPENTLGAFRAAIEHGYAIECDLQPSADGEAMVFHDAELARLVGREGRTAETETDALQRMRVLGSDEAVPTLEELLELVDDAVPIVLELKGPQADNEGFVQRVADVSASYGGRLAVMSFRHALLKRFALSMPDRPRGLTAQGGDERFDLHNRIYDEADLSFVSYDVDALPNRFVDRVREGGGAALTWTVTTPEQAERSARYADQMTFEGFRP